MNDRSHLGADPKAVTRADRLGNDLCEPGSEDRQLRRIDPRNLDSQHDEYGADYNTLKASSEHGVRNDRKRLVDYHVRQEESYEQKVPVLPDRLDLLRIAFLLSVRRARVKGLAGLDGR